MKFEVLVDNGEEKQYYFHCPGCGHAHSVRSRGHGAIWGVTGVSDNLPTVIPSIRVRVGEKVCHSFVRAGKIQYLSDCTHSMVGQTVELPDADDV